MKKFFKEQTSGWIRSRQENVPAMAARTGFASCFWIALVLLALGNSGCDRQRSSAVVGHGSTASLANRSPEEMYKGIITMFRREVEKMSTDTSSGHGVVSTHKIERKVKDKLIPPATSADHYKARVTVETRLNSTFRSTVDHEEDEDEKEQKAGTTAQGGVAEPFADSDSPLLEDFDSSLATNLKTSQGHLKDLVKPVLNERVNEYEDIYELEFKDGRWTLAKAPEEKFIQETFEYVLNRQ
jgi:hypothetical protein